MSPIQLAEHDIMKAAQTLDIVPVWWFFGGAACHEGKADPKS